MKQILLSAFSLLLIKESEAACGPYEINTDRGCISSCLDPKYKQC